MPRFESGTVKEVLDTRKGVQRVLVTVGDSDRRATVFTNVSGSVSEGDQVIVNTTGVDLELGTGGEDFVLWNLQRSEAGEMSTGHILKLRYTPWQIDSLTAEAPESPHHEKLTNADSIHGLPVVACGLHSQVAAAAAVLRSRLPRARIVYVMTDGAALPLVHSDLIAELSAKGLIDSTITAGHAFGGDLECVNVFSALLTASEVCDADVCIVAMGPGVVGTGTPFGHTEMEQGHVLSCAAALGGVGVAVLRISFADTRPRHKTISHHSVTALTKGTASRSRVAVPLLAVDRFDAVMSKMQQSGIAALHDIAVIDATVTKEAMAQFGLATRSMGRSMQDDPEFFLAAGAAGVMVADLLEESHAGS